MRNEGKTSPRIYIIHPTQSKHTNVRVDSENEKRTRMYNICILHRTNKQRRTPTRVECLHSPTHNPSFKGT
ncbi:unnamed protein product [Prunus brigantina]